MASLRAEWVWVASSLRGQVMKRAVPVLSTNRGGLWWLTVIMKTVLVSADPWRELGPSMDIGWEAERSMPHSSPFFLLMLAWGWPVNLFLWNFRVGLSRSLWESFLFPKRLKKDVALLFLWRLSWLWVLELLQPFCNQQRDSAPFKEPPKSYG